MVVICVQPLLSKGDAIGLDKMGSTGPPLARAVFIGQKGMLVIKTLIVSSSVIVIATTLAFVIV